MSVLSGGEELIEGGAVEILAAEPDGLDLRGAVNLGEGIGREEDEVGALSRRDGAEFRGATERFRRAQRGGLQSGERSEAGFDEQGEFVVQAETGHAVGVHGVGSGKQGHTGAEERKASGVMPVIL